MHIGRAQPARAVEIAHACILQTAVALCEADGIPLAPEAVIVYIAQGLAVLERIPAYSDHTDREDGICHVLAIDEGILPDAGYPVSDDERGDLVPYGIPGRQRGGQVAIFIHRSGAADRQGAAGKCGGQAVAAGIGGLLIDRKNRAWDIFILFAVVGADAPLLR